jgi:hypothetical protein
VDVHVPRDHLCSGIIVVFETLEFGERVGQSLMLFLCTLPLRLQLGTNSLKLDLHPANLVPQGFLRAFKLLDKPVQPHLPFLQSLKSRCPASILLWGFAVRGVRTGGRCN